MEVYNRFPDSRQKIFLWRFTADLQHASNCRELLNYFVSLSMCEDVMLDTSANYSAATATF
jgi:hypothetical protein